MRSMLGMDALALHSLHTGTERTGAFEFCRCVFQRLTASSITLNGARSYRFLGHKKSHPMGVAFFVWR